MGHHAVVWRGGNTTYLSLTMLIAKDSGDLCGLRAMDCIVLVWVFKVQRHCKALLDSTHFEMLEMSHAWALGFQKDGW